MCVRVGVCRRGGGRVCVCVKESRQGEESYRGGFEVPRVFVLRQMSVCLRSGLNSNVDVLSINLLFEDMQNSITFSYKYTLQFLLLGI